MEFVELTNLFSVGFENYILGGKILVGLFILGFTTYFSFRCRLGLDAVVVIMAPMVTLLARFGYLPFVMFYLGLIAIGGLLGLGMYKWVT